MSKIVLGRYPLPPYKGPVMFMADAFWESNYNIFGIADSDHPYNLYPISERDIQAAFALVRSELAKYSPNPDKPEPNRF